MLDLSLPRFEPLTREEEEAIAARLVAAIEANDEQTRSEICAVLIERNLRLIMYIGRQYGKRLDREEIFSVGCVALTRAVNRWDPRKGHLYGWATRWITTALTRAVDASRTIRIPQAVAHEAAMVQKDVAAEEAKLGRPLTESEYEEMTRGRSRFEHHPHVVSSLTTLPSADNDVSVTLEETLPAEGVDPGEEAAFTDLAHRVRSAMRELTPLEQKVIAARFGIDDQPMRTLSDLGKEHEVSGEAMRRVELSALAKLRHPAVRLTFSESSI